MESEPRFTSSSLPIEPSREMKMYTSSRFSIANQTISTRDSLPFPCLPRTLALCFGRLIGYSLLMGHDLIDRRSLELNKLVAKKIRQQP